MSNYTQSTNFATKDALTSGDPLKIVKGTEINTEFVNISVAIATKADLASPTFTGTPALPTGTTGVTQTAGDTTTALATTAFVQAADSAAITAERTATATLTNKSLTSPTLTGTPIAPTAALNTNTTQVATTAFVVDQIADDAPTKTGTGASGTWGIDITGNAATATKLTTASGSAPSYSARAWVNFNGTGTIGTNQTIRASANVASVFKNATGDYTITFTTALPDENYTFSGTAMRPTVSSDGYFVMPYNSATYSDAYAAGSLRIRVSAASAGSAQDSFAIAIAVFR
jgi:hypothetical protein